MRKFIITALAALALAPAAQAQVNFWDEGTPEKTVTYGARLGLNISKVGTYEHFSWDNKSGLLLGAAVDWHLINSLSINTGLYFSMKGAKCKFTEMDDEGGSNYFYSSVYTRMTYNVLEVPVYVNYHFTVAPESQIQVFFGPYFDLGIYGKQLVKETQGDHTVQESWSLFDGDEDDGAKRFNCGVGLGAAYTWHNCQIALQYQWGLTNIAKDYKAGWNTFSIVLGYNFSL